MNERFTIELGSKVKSDVSGFTGIVTSRSEHLNGCNRYWVTPAVGKDGKLPDGYWFDEKELIVVSKPNLERETRAKKSTNSGGFPSQIK